jgi:hypothetical protein
MKNKNPTKIIKAHTKAGRDWPHFMRDDFDGVHVPEHLKIRGRSICLDR